MVYVKTPSGGEVFAVGSITFCGSLPWNNFDNNVSRLLRNVVASCRYHLKTKLHLTKAFQFSATPFKELPIRTAIASSWGRATICRPTG